MRVVTAGTLHPIMVRTVRIETTIRILGFFLDVCQRVTENTALGGHICVRWRSIHPVAAQAAHPFFLVNMIEKW